MRTPSLLLVALLSLASLEAQTPSTHTAAYDPNQGKSDTVKVTVGPVSGFQAKPSSGWRDNGTTFTANAALEATLTIEGSIDTKPWSYFDFENVITIKGNDQVLFHQTPKIPKEGGRATFSFTFDPARNPGVRRLSISVSSLGGNPEYSRHWVSGTIQIGGGAAPAPAPSAPVVAPLPAKGPAAPAKTVNDAAAGAVEDLIRQFEGTCFGRVVRLGDPGKYRKALGEVWINTHGSLVTGSRAKGSHMEGGALGNAIHLPFDPLAGPLTAEQQKTLWHEATHQIEVKNGHRQKANGDMTGHRERNTAYLDRLVDALRLWRRTEEQVRDGRTSPEEAAATWRDFERRLKALEAGQGVSEVDGAEGQFWKPDFRDLEAWAGVHARIDEIRQLYLSGACDPRLAEMVKQAQGSVGRLGDE